MELGLYRPSGLGFEHLGRLPGFTIEAQKLETL